MKNRNKFILSALLGATFILTGVVVGGCNKSADSIDTTSATPPKKELAQATPPPNFDTSGLSAQQEAAKKAAEDVQKQIEAGKK